MKTFFGSMAKIKEQRDESGKLYHEFLRVPSMSAGLYILAAEDTDKQMPHREDEIYYVIRGHARFKAGPEDREVSPGDVLFVAAEIEHRFYDITQELAALVFFAPAET